MPAPDRPPWVAHALQTVAQRVRGYRIDGNLTQDELAFRTGIDSRTIQRIEAGRYEVKLTHLARVARALNVRMTDLLD